MSRYQKKLRKSARRSLPLSSSPISPGEGCSKTAQHNQQSKRKCLSENTVKTTDEKNSNAVLFIFKTKKPVRIFLNVPKGLQILSTKDLPAYCDIPPNGHIKFLKALRDSYAVFVFVFQNKTACSSCCQDDLKGVKFFYDCFPDKKVSEKMQEHDEGSLAGWAFYCLHQKPPDRADDSYVFPTASGEGMRVIHLKEALKQKYTIMKEGHPSSSAVSINLFQSATRGYCQFSGGGDLLIADAYSTLTIRSNTHVDTEPSPNNSGDEILQEVVEAKDVLAITQPFLWQLFANMILATIETLISQIENDYYNSKEELLRIRRFVGYGIILTGSFWFSFFKIMIDVTTGQIEITEKIKPGCRSPIGVVKCLDFCVEYFLCKRM